MFSNIFQKTVLCAALLIPFCTQALEEIQHDAFPEYSAPIKAQSQKDFDYLNKHLGLAYRFYNNQQADSFTARMKLSCQQSGMAYTYQDFVLANKQYASADDLDFSASDTLLRINASQHGNRCSKYLNPHDELEHNSAPKNQI